MPMDTEESCRRIGLRSSFLPGKSVYPQENLATFSLADIRFRRVCEFQDEDACPNCGVSRLAQQNGSEMP